VNPFEEPQCDAFGATDIDGNQPVTPLYTNSVHQHFVANIAFEVRADIADSGIDICDQRRKFVIHGGQKRVPCGDIGFRGDRHAGGFTTAGRPASFMMESPYGYDSQSFVDDAAAGQVPECESAHCDVLRESQLPCLQNM
jgi:hypothetical protein